MKTKKAIRMPLRRAPQRGRSAAAPLRARAAALPFDSTVARGPQPQYGKLPLKVKACCCWK